jgi:hypothetical protein
MRLVIEPPHNIVTVEGDAKVLEVTPKKEETNVEVAVKMEAAKGC